MADIIGFDVPIPSMGFGLGVEMWLWIFGAILFLILAGIAMFFISRFKVYNKQIIVFENIAGQGYQVVFKDRARLVKLGDGGEEILHLLKKKVYRTAYGKKMGKQTYWFAVGQDGYWYNIILGDVDAKMGMLDIEPIDRDMRYMHVAIRRNIQDRYRKQSFMDKYGDKIFNMITGVVLMVGIWFCLDKIADMASSVASAVKTGEQVQLLAKETLASIDNICGGSGIRKA